MITNTISADETVTSIKFGFACAQTQPQK